MSSKIVLLNKKRYCADPYNKHKKRIKKSLRDVSITVQARLGLSEHDRLCRNCEEDVQQMEEEKVEEQTRHQEGLDEHESDLEDDMNFN